MEDLLRKVFVGDPLVSTFPVQFRHVHGCDTIECVDLSKVYIASYVFHAILFVLTYMVSTNVSRNFRSLPHHEKIYWAMSVVSGLHSVWSAFGSFKYVIFNDIFDDGELQRHIIEQDIVSTMTSGYLAYDLTIHVVMALRGFQDFNSIGVYVHHGFGIMCFPQLTFFPLSWLAGIWQATEISGPFVNMRYILSKGGYREHWSYKINGIMMFLTFLAFRVIHVIRFWITFYGQHDLFVDLFHPPIYYYFFWMCAGAATTLNSYWFYLISRGLFDVLVHGKSKLEKKKA